MSSYHGPQYPGLVPNSWTQDVSLESFKIPFEKRSTEIKTCSLFLNGIEDKRLYQTNLFAFGQDVNHIDFDHRIPMPKPDELTLFEKVTDKKQQVYSIGKVLNLPNRYLSIKNVYMSYMLNLMDDLPDSKFTTSAIVIASWLMRYRKAFEKQTCFVYFGCPKAGFEMMFFNLLSRLPVDTLIVDGNKEGDKSLYPQFYCRDGQYSIPVNSFPTRQPSIDTVARCAEKEVKGLLMNLDPTACDSADVREVRTVTLNTMFEELHILWDVGISLRYEFGVKNHVLTMPVICAKFSGLPDDSERKFWKIAKELFSEHAIFKFSARATSANIASLSVMIPRFYAQGKILRERVMQNSNYKYGKLPVSKQEQIFDAIDSVLASKNINSSGRPIEYTIINTLLNLDNDIVDLIHRFNFTGNSVGINPKIVFILDVEGCDKRPATIEDAIIIQFLNEIGFDVVALSPKGYQWVEQYYKYSVVSEQVVGDFATSVSIPFGFKKSCINKCFACD